MDKHIQNNEENLPGEDLYETVSQNEFKNGGILKKLKALPIKDSFPILISAIALTFSVSHIIAQLIYGGLASPEINGRIGGKLRFSYTEKYDFMITTPITLWNSGRKYGTIEVLALHILGKNCKQFSYLLLPAKYQEEVSRIHTEFTWKKNKLISSEQKEGKRTKTDRGPPKVIPLFPNEIVDKTVQFRCPASIDNKKDMLDFCTGDYIIRLLAWDNKKGKFRTLYEADVAIGAKMASKLNSRRVLIDEKGNRNTNLIPIANLKHIPAPSGPFDATDLIQ